jgi:hypothetical protein
VFAHLHRPDGRDAMLVVGGGNGDRVNVLADFVEQLAVVAVLLELGELLRELLGFRAQRIRVHIANGNDIAAALVGVTAVAVAFAADANAGDVDAVIGPQPAPCGSGIDGESMSWVWRRWTDLYFACSEQVTKRHAAGMTTASTAEGNSAFNGSVEQESVPD